MPGPIHSSTTTRSKYVQAETFAPPTKAPPAPEELGDHARELWETFWRSPVARLLTEVDYDALERYCRCSEALRTLSPASTNYARLEGLVQRLETALLLTPVARAKAGVRLAELSQATPTSIRDSLDDGQG